jgi:hypothetical protein
MANVTINGTTIGSVQPNAPSGLTTATAFDGVQLDWTNPTNTPIDYIQIAASTTNNVAAGFSTVANVKTTAFYDHSTAGGVRYYWVRAVSTLGNIGPWNAGDTSGVAGSPQEVTITTPARGEVVVYDGTVWVNTANIAQNISGNAALTVTRVTSGTGRTAFRLKKAYTAGARLQGDGPNLVFQLEGTDGGYDMLGIRGSYDTGGDHTLTVFNSTATDNSFSPSASIFTANSAQMSVAGTLTMEQAANTAMPTGRPGALCSVSNNSYKLAYYNGASWRYVADDSAV